MEDNNNKPEITEENIAEMLKKYTAEQKDLGIDPLLNLQNSFNGIIQIPNVLLPKQVESEILHLIMEHEMRLKGRNGESNNKVTSEELKATLKEEGFEDISDKIFAIRDKSLPKSDADNKPKND